MDASCMAELGKMGIVNIEPERYAIEKPDGNRVPILISEPECSVGNGAGAENETAVIIVHGLGASKKAVSTEYYRRYFNSRGLAVIAYDQPGHGESEEPMGVDRSLESLKAVELFAKEKFPGREICYFGSSYGAYITGLYVRKCEHLGYKAFMRSGAMIFPEMILSKVNASDLSRIELGNASDLNIIEFRNAGDLNRTDAENADAKAFDGTKASANADAEADSNPRADSDCYIDVDLGIGEMSRFPKSFIEELREEGNDLIELYRKEKPKDVDIKFYHGGDDPVVPVDRIRDFARENGYEITVIPGEGHSICNRPEDTAALGEAATEFFTRENG